MRSESSGTIWSSGVKPAPVYRYVDSRGAKTEPRSLREALGLPSLVKAKKSKDDDGGVMLVYGASGEIVGLEPVAGDHQEELHNKTQQLIDRTDGPLHRDIAKHLVLDANPKLADEHEGQDELQAAQMELKSRIKAMQLGYRRDSLSALIDPACAQRHHPSGVMLKVGTNIGFVRCSFPN